MVVHTAKYKPRKINKKFVVFFIIVLSLNSCTHDSSQKSEESIEDVKTILVHCGVTMVKPITEIAKIIEEQEKCKVLIAKGASGNLYQSIVNNKIGDLYLPGSEQYIVDAMKEGYVLEKTYVGINKASIMVQKNNPKKIQSSLECLKDTNLRIVIGNPSSGSIGKETKIVLDKLGIYNEVKKRAEYITIDSRDLIKALKNDEADIIINWFATSVWDDNSQFVDVLEINENSVIQENKLYLGLLTFSQYPDISKKMMMLAASERGQQIFRKYGL